MTFDKPIPVSPLIALDRERCILCYRCTRFSSDVAEDGQLIARNRGAHTEIATFGEDPYRAPFSGNVIELCPVGALTSTQYRFQARPWEIQDVPTVCGLCPAGCNIRATTREGDVKRVLSRNHPEIDGGWLCDKGRFSYPHLQARDRILEPLARGEHGLQPIGWDEALDRAEALLREAGGRIVTALSGSETTEIAYGLGVLMRRGLGAHSAVLHESTSAALDAFRAPLSTIGDAEIVVVVGDDAVVDRAPAVELWLKQARRNGAEVVTIGAEAHDPGRTGRRGGRAAGARRRREARSASACATASGRSSSGPGPGGGRRRAPRRGGARARLRGEARLRRVPPARRRRTPAASARPGPRRPTRTRSRARVSASSSSPATRPRPTRACAHSPRRPSASSRSRCSRRSPPAGPTSCCPPPRRSSARAPR